jgi:hypothetical protein
MRESPRPSLRQQEDQSIDIQLKDRMLFQLTVENKRYREENAQQKGKIFQLEADMDFLRTTIEQNLPYFNNLEETNRSL